MNVPFSSLSGENQEQTKQKYDWLKWVVCSTSINSERLPICRLSIQYEELVLVWLFKYEFKIRHSTLQFMWKAECEHLGTRAHASIIILKLIFFDEFRSEKRKIQNDFIDIKN